MQKNISQDRKSLFSKAKRIVVKVGSAVLTGAGEGLDQKRIEQLASEVTAIMEGGREVILVSSGAIAAGLAKMGLKQTRGMPLPLKQAAAIGCSLCAAACPADAIFVESAENTDEQRFSPGERYASTYEINMLRCIFCGYCEDACPTEAIVLGDNYELSFTNRRQAIYTKELLLESVKETSMTTPQRVPPGVFIRWIPVMHDPQD